MNINAPINVTLNTGSTLPFRPTTSKHGNLFWGILGTKADGSKYYRKFGVRAAISVVGGRLPVKANVLGQTFSSTVLKDEQGRSLADSTDQPGSSHRSRTATRSTPSLCASNSASGMR